MTDFNNIPNLLKKMTDMIQGNFNMVAYAVEWGKLGFEIFPCNPDKSPLVDPIMGLTHGVKEASSDLHKIARIWHRHKEANIGWAISEGYIVIDCDILKGQNKNPILDPKGNIIPQGLISFKKIIKQYGKGAHVHTLITRTQSGGAQYFFKLREDQKRILEERNTEITNRTNLWDHVDLKTYGGYVLLPPSKGTLGSYQFIEVYEIADLPDWLFNVLLQQYKPNPVIAMEKIRFKDFEMKKIQKIIGILLPYWKKADHRRNDLTLTINGMLALRGVKAEARNYILNELCRLTGKGCDHVNAYKYTDQRLREGKPVKGKASFEELINEIEGVLNNE